jgi:hypothetical protein
MKEESTTTRESVIKLANGNDDIFPAFPLYPVDDDLYNKLKQEQNIDPEDILKVKESTQNDVADNDLDVPGSELDDQQENIGSEDEENNSYSLGGDNHNDLEENQG